MQVNATCPHCSKDIRLDVPDPVPPRSTSGLAMVVAMLFVTLVTATVGSYIGVRYFAYEMAKSIDERMKQADPRWGR